MFLKYLQTTRAEPGPNPKALNPVLISPVRGRDPPTWVIIFCLPWHSFAELGVDPGLEPRPLDTECGHPKRQLNCCGKAHPGFFGYGCLGACELECCLVVSIKVPFLVVLYCPGALPVGSAHVSTAGRGAEHMFVFLHRVCKSQRL